MGSVQTCKAGRRSSRYRWYDVGVSSYSPQQTIVRAVGSPCIRKLFSKDHPVGQHPPKADGSKRMMGLPTLLDRIAQQVVRVHLEKCLEPHFHQNSYGYRPGKSMHDALSRAKFNCRQYPYVITLDINPPRRMIPYHMTNYCRPYNFIVKING